MSCPSIAALAATCGVEGGIGGLKPAVYVVAYNDLDNSTGATYTETAGLISAIHLVTAKKFVKIDVPKNTSGVDEKNTVDYTKGLDYYVQSLSFRLNTLSPESKVFLQSVSGQPIAAIVQHQNGKYYAVGLNGNMWKKSADGGTGVQESDGFGRTLTFECGDINPLSEVDSSIISGLIA